MDVAAWPAILIMVIFLLTNALVVFPVRILIPETLASLFWHALVKYKILSPLTETRLHRTHLVLDFRTIPLLGVLILLATGAIDGTVVRRGILGADGVKPIDIMSLFISLAYLSISLDATGLFRFLAFWVARKGGSSGQRLYFYLYAFFLVFGVIVGNDPVILSGTAFLAYFTRVSGIVPPTAWICAQFSAANMASVVLVSSNPTNLVLSGSFSLPFTTYTAHVIIPFLAAAILVYLILAFILFRSHNLIPPSIDLHLEDDAGSPSTLVDKKGAIFGSVLVLLTLAILVGTSTVGVPVWRVTVPPAVVMLLRDFFHDWSHFARRRKTSRVQKAPSGPNDPDDSGGSTAGNALAEIELRDIGHNDPPCDSSASPSRSLASMVTGYATAFSSTFPTVSIVLQRLPVPLLPFAFLMFILVQGLASKGWVEVFAGWWASWATRTGVLGAIGGMGFVACMFCNFCGTNIGATILLARIIQLWISASEPDTRMKNGTIYALALGSNYGAFTLSFSASLAGLLWRGILRQKGIIVHPKQFLYLNMPIVFTAMLASSAVLVAQTYIETRLG